PATAPPAIACASSDDAGTPDAGCSVGPTCDSTQTCGTPISGQTGAASGLCIYQSGVQTCPTGAYSVQHIVGASVADSRGCSCGCVNPTCPADGYVTGYTSNSCGGTAAVTIAANTACMVGADIKNNVAFIY